MFIDFLHIKITLALKLNKKVALYLETQALLITRFILQIHQKDWETHNHVALSLSQIQQQPKGNSVVSNEMPKLTDNLI